MTSCFNGAATFRPRKALSPTPWPACPGCFNGAATFRPRKAASARHACLARTLQWGRDLSAAEGPRPAPASLPARRASMGPRPFGRGRSATAAPAKPPAKASMGPRPFGRGRWPERGSGPPPLPASMGPRPFGRGRRKCVRAMKTKTIGFNGAATFRPRKGLRRRAP